MSLHYLTSTFERVWSILLRIYCIVNTLHYVVLLLKDLSRRSIMFFSKKCLD
jgi:hypothetical protein